MNVIKSPCQKKNNKIKYKNNGNYTENKNNKLSSNN